MKSNLLSLKSIALFICLSFININDSLAINWVGGNGNWNDAFHWNTGVLPVATDEIIIPGGITITVPNGYTGHARSVKVNVGAKLQVNTTGTLRINGALDKPGILNLGKVVAYGSLEISNVNVLLQPISVANGVTNRGRFLVQSSGTLDIKTTANAGIENDVVPTILVNRGTITIDDTSIVGIENSGTVKNYGTIDIIQGNSINEVAFLNHEDIENHTTGIINLDGGDKGFFNDIAASDIENAGELNCVNASRIGIHNFGYFRTSIAALVTVENNTNANFWNEPTGHLVNLGSCFLLGNCLTGFYNNGFVENHNILEISNTTNNALFTRVGSSFVNLGLLHFHPNQSFDLKLKGTLVNNDTGEIIQNNRFRIYNSGTLTNDGIVRSESNDTHINAIPANFVNNGIIVDKYDQFQPIVNNLQVIVGSISTPLNVGFPYSPALNVAASNNVTFGLWRTSPGGIVSAGPYNAFFNNYIPSMFSVGHSIIYPDITINSSGILHHCEILLSNPIAPFQKDPKDEYQFRAQEPEQSPLRSTTNFSLYPNPTNGVINLEGNQKSQSVTLVKVMNLQGRQVFQQEFSSDQQLQINLPSVVTTGMYLVNIFQDGAFVDAKKVQVIKE